MSLAEILRARQEGLPYLETAGGWIDLNAPVFRELDRLGEAGDADRFRLPPSELLRLQAAAGQPVRVAGEGDLPRPVLGPPPRAAAGRAVH